MPPPPNQASLYERSLRTACGEVTRRVAGGQTHVAESVLDQHPELAENADAALEVVYAEFVACEEAGQTADIPLWLERFPALRERLERLLRLHAVLGGESPAGEPDGPGPGSGRLQEREHELPLGVCGPYELLEEIARGGMGIVYRARQTSLGRTVAVKVLQSQAVTHDERGRFHGEAAAIASLQHPGIVQIFEVGTHQGTDYLSMEFVPGGSLDKQIRSREWTNPDIARLMALLAEAVEHAHQHGIVHRDLKPANVLIDRSGSPKIADFGLAKRWQQAFDRKTQTGAIVGTPGYMSPEQAGGKHRQVSPATDIFSLGVILYELLTGRLPFEAETTLETLALIAAHEPVLPSRIAPERPRDLETICLKCLNKLPEERYPTAGALAEDLRRFLDHRPILARRATLWERSVRWMYRHPQLTVMAGVLAVVLCLASTLLLWQQQRLRLLARKSSANERGEAQQRARASEAEQAYEQSLLKARNLVARWSELGQRLENEPGMGEVRRRAYEDAIAYYEEILATRQAEPAVQLEAATASTRAAVFHAELGLWDEAEKGLRRSHQWLAALEPNRRNRWEQAHVQVQLGHVLRRQERKPEAEAAYCEAIAMYRGLIRENPADPWYHLRLSNALVNLCIFQNEKGSWDASIRMYLEADAEMREAVSLRAGLDPDPKAGRAGQTPLEVLVAESIAATRRLREKLPAAVPEPVLRALARENFFAELALSLDDIGQVLRHKKWLELAQAACLEANELRELTTRQVPDDRRMQQYLARGKTRLAGFQIDADQPLEAIQSLQQAEALLRQLVLDFPERQIYFEEVAVNLSEQVRACVLLDRIPDAIAFARQSVEITRTMADGQPGLSHLRESHAVALHRLATLLIQSGQREEIRQLCDQALAMDAGPVSRCRFAWTILGDRGGDAQSHSHALGLAREAVAIAPDRAACHSALALALYRCRSFPEAREAILRAMELDGGGSAGDWFVAALIESALHNPDDAGRWYDRGREWQDQHPSPGDATLPGLQQEALESVSRPPVSDR